MQETIDTINSAIDFLANDSPNKSTRNKVIVNTQARAFAFSDEAKKFAKENDFRKGSIATYLEWIKNNYKWAIKN